MKLRNKWLVGLLALLVSFPLIAGGDRVQWEPLTSDDIQGAIVGIPTDNQVIDFNAATNQFNYISPGDIAVTISTSAPLGGDGSAGDPVKLDAGLAGPGEVPVANGAGGSAFGLLAASEVTNVAAGDIVATDLQAAVNELDTDKLALAGGALSGAVTTSSTFDGRDVSVDGAKLDGIEALADVTDDANVRAALAAATATIDVNGQTISNVGTIDGIDISSLATATVWTSAASGDFSAENNVGALGDGLIKHASGVPALAVANADYQVPRANTITVAKAGGDHLTIAAAIAAASAGDTIRIFPGAYSEDNSGGPLVQPTGVSIHGIGGHQNVTVAFTTTTQHGFQVGSSTSFGGIGLSGVTGALKACVHIPAGVVHNHMQDVETNDCEIGVLVDASDDANDATEIFVRGTGTRAQGIKLSAGSHYTVHDAELDSGLTLTDFALVDGAGTEFHLFSSHLQGALSTNGIHVTNTADAQIIGVHLNGFTNALRIGASDGLLFALSCDIESSDTWDVLVEGGAGSSFYTGGTRATRSMLSISAGSSVQGSIVSDLEGDRALLSIGELAVGLPLAGKESVFGEGDSHTDDMHVFTNTSLEAGTWADVTTAAASATGSTFTLLPGITADNCVFVGSENAIFPGIKVTMDSTAITLGAGAINEEFWNGSAWTDFNLMATDADMPYNQYADAVFQRASQSDQVRFGPMTGWASKSLNGQVAFWMRWCVTTGITTSPVLQQVKVHTNRFEINLEGFAEQFGDAIEERSMPLPEHRALKAPAAPGNVVVTVSASIEYTGSRNSYSTGDGVVYIVPVPDGLDTSQPLTFRTLWKPSSTNAGDVNFNLIVSEGDIGDVVDGTIAETAVSVIQAASGTTDAIQALTEHSFSVPDVIPGDVIFIAHTRAAASDTFTGNVEILRRELEGHFWR